MNSSNTPRRMTRWAGNLLMERSDVPVTLGHEDSSGVRTLDKLLEVRALGVARAGASRTAEILDEYKRRLGKENNR